MVKLHDFYAEKNTFQNFQGLFFKHLAKLPSLGIQCTRQIVKVGKGLYLRLPYR